ncbi:MAG TPA: CPBP family intramembrane glutamic endopeptidase [Pirellulaceae bacterium]|nr:CPBP family intramembrane glutamic endopeptidase [Pirellulaceae bacterium]
MFPSAAYLNLAGWFHLGFFGVYLPIMAARNRKKVLGSGGALPDRLRHFQRTALEVGLLAICSLLVARVQRIELFPLAFPPLGAVIAGVVAYAAAVAYMRPNWRRAVERRARVVHLFMPSNMRERIWWIIVAVIAGVGEEITWRGTQAALVGALTGSFWAASLVCSITFGLVHIVQGWKSAALIVVFALGFHLLVWLAGSLYVAMAVHVAYDLTVGISYERLGKQLGYDPAQGC